LRGEMSLIGPRPVPLEIYEEYCEKIPNYKLRHLVRPGLTGLAQIQQGYTFTLEGEREKWALDIEFIENLSPKIDAFVVLGTVKTIANGFGVR
jgi:lipopolysaccharide/colanic/teichoic acid biosynthesis glycosyltransferase